jgi:hypothetical protein
LDRVIRSVRGCFFSGCCRDPKYKTKAQQAMLGIYYDDEYDYSQHLRDVGGADAETIEADPKDVENILRSREPSVVDRESKAGGLLAAALGLPNEALPSAEEEEIGLLNRAATSSGPNLDWDPEIVGSSSSLSLPRIDHTRVAGVGSCIPAAALSHRWLPSTMAWTLMTRKISWTTTLYLRQAPMAPGQRLLGAYPAVGVHPRQRHKQKGMRLGSSNAVVTAIKPQPTAQRAKRMRMTLKSANGAVLAMMPAQALTSAAHGRQRGVDPRVAAAARRMTSRVRYAPASPSTPCPQVSSHVRNTSSGKTTTLRGSMRRCEARETPLRLRPECLSKRWRDRRGGEDDEKESRPAACGIL